MDQPRPWPGSAVPVAVARAAAADGRILGGGGHAPESKDAGDRAGGEQLVVRRPSGKSDDGALERADQGQRDRAGRRSGGNRTRPCARG